MIFFNLIMHSPNQIEKEMNHLLFNLFELDPEDEEESIFISILRDIASKNGADCMALFPYKDLHITGLNLPIHLSVEVKSIQFYLKHL